MATTDVGLNGYCPRCAPGTASHSGVGSAGPFRGRKRSLYEGGVRLPFIARWPSRIPAGRVDNTSVISVRAW